MNREDFLSFAFRKRLPYFRQKKKNKVYEYYNEIILDKKKEGGLEETDIIAEFGDIDDIAAKLLSEFPEAGKRQETADTPGESSQQSVWPYPAPSVYVPALQKRSAPLGPGSSY